MRLQAFSKKHLLAVLLLCSLAMSLAGSGAARPLRHATHFALAPLGDALMYASTSLAGTMTAEPVAKLSAADARKLIDENAELRKQVDLWQATSEYYWRQNIRLENFKQMYGWVGDVSCELIPAHVVGTGSLAYDQTRVLSPGSQQGVEAGDLVASRDRRTSVDVATSRSKVLPDKLAVVTSSSLVGRVVDSGAFTARVQLVTDKDFQMSGRIRRLYVPGRSRTITTEGPQPQTTQLTEKNNAPIDVLITGDGAGMVVVPGVKAYHNVLPGDYLWARATEQNIPMEIYVGQVVKVEPSPDMKDAHRVRVYVRPHEDLAAVRDVFIISPVAPLPEKR